MNAIFGIVRKDGGPVPRDLAEQLAIGTAADPRMVIEATDLGACVLGCARWPEPAARGRATSLWAEGRAAHLAINARLDGTTDLRRAIGASADDAGDDVSLLARAYAVWGDACAARVLGDWTFAAWRPLERSLLLARESCGLSPMFYADLPEWFIFSGRWTALAALPVVPRVRDDEYLASLFLTGLALEDRTACRAIRTLRSAQQIRVGRDGAQVAAYWVFSQAEDVARLSRAEAAGGLRAVLREAVRDRLRGRSSVALTLTGGLDSGALAATLSDVRGTCEVRPLTHAPYYPASDTRLRVADEAPFAAATARFAGLSPIRRVDSVGTSPILAIRRAVELTGGTHVAAAQIYFVSDLIRAASDEGADRLLIGQAGNETISWAGPSSRWERWSRAVRLRLGAASVDRAVRRRASLLKDDWVAQVDEGRRSPNVSNDSVRAALFFDRRLESWNELAAPSPLMVTDPTQDRRVVEFCWSVNPRWFRGPRGARRWLLREAMADRLPADVLSGAGRGRQGADLGARLRATASDVEAVIADLDQPIPAQVVDVPRLRAVWASISATTDGSNHPELRNLCAAIQLGLVASFLAQNQATARNACRVIWMTILTSTSGRPYDSIR